MESVRRRPPETADAQGAAIRAEEPRGRAPSTGGPGMREINIKQAIPLALIIHEIIALFCTQKECESVLSHLHFTIKTPEIVVINSSVSELLEIAEISEYLIKELMEQIL